ncbi:hypothetical protein EV681_4274 [Advenella incenata]|uniref:Uncharacterized protein n=1 Tax=Advenella incenata TaxID=267800 RepID=A0A4V2FRS1_9BURK|nr:hypothetical protein EV681_4274 [Advenella incenata]
MTIDIGIKSFIGMKSIFLRGVTCFLQNPVTVLQMQLRAVQGYGRRRARVGIVVSALSLLAFRSVISLLWDYAYEKIRFFTQQRDAFASPSV